MRRTFGIVLSAVALAGTCRVGLAQIEPAAGSWKTWVIQPSAYRLAAASGETLRSEVEWLKSFRDIAGANERAQIAYWDAGSPSYRWVQLLANLIVERGINTPNGTRMMALLNVAIYDATIACWDSKYANNRPRPAVFDRSVIPSIATPNSPSFPAEHAVAAGAASAVLSYLFPQDAPTFLSLAEEAGRSRLFAGVHYPSDVTAGLDLGRSIGGAIVERGRADGSSVAWTGTVPTEAGLWRGTNPVLPLAGTWKTWAISRGDEFRPGPPLPYNSPEKAAEIAEIKAMPRAFADQARAFYYQSGDGVFAGWYNLAHQAIFEDRMDVNAPRAARIYALMSVAHYDSMVACWDGKYAYWAIRPVQLDSTVTTLFATPNHPSYPAAHSTNSTSITEILAYLLPERAGRIRQLGLDAGLSRITAGIHYRSDHDSGVTLGRQVAGRVIEWARADGSE